VGILSSVMTTTTQSALVSSLSVAPSLTLQVPDEFRTSGSLEPTLSTDITQDNSGDSNGNHGVVIYEQIHSEKQPVDSNAMTSTKISMQRPSSQPSSPLFKLQIDTARPNSSTNPPIIWLRN